MHGHVPRPTGKDDSDLSCHFRDGQGIARLISTYWKGIASFGIIFGDFHVAKHVPNPSATPKGHSRAEGCLIIISSVFHSISPKFPICGTVPGFRSRKAFDTCVDPFHRCASQQNSFTGLTIVIAVSFVRNE